MAPTNPKYEVLEAKLDEVKEDIKEIKSVLHAQYVTHAEFSPVKQIVFGLVATILLSVIGAALAVLFKGG